MKRSPLLILAVAACSAGKPIEQYGFVATLGRDTVSVENVTRKGNEITSEGVDRFPRVKERRTRITVGEDGAIKRLVMDIHAPSEPLNLGDRHVEVDVADGVVRISRRDGSRTVRRDFKTDGRVAMAHVPQMYSLYELIFASAAKRAGKSMTARDDTVRFRQFYVDREFDNFPLHRGFVRLAGDGKTEIRHDWLSGIGEATLDSAHHMLSYSGARTTYDVRVKRIEKFLDVRAIGERFAALEAQNGVKSLSVRDTTRARLGDATFMVDYGRPLARGRVILGNVVRYDAVWRTGANAATQFTTSVPIEIGGLPVPAGSYTLWTVPRMDGAELLLNRQTGQWGTDYHREQDLGRVKLITETVSKPVEKFTISIATVDARHVNLVMEWDTFRWTAPIVIP